jgi:hypothetical protein
MAAGCPANCAQACFFGPFPGAAALEPVGDWDVYDPARQERQPVARKAIGGFGLYGATLTVWKPGFLNSAGVF